jgi:hypothetical protein
VSCNAPGKAPNERVLGHETFGPLIQLTEGLLPPSFSWLLFPFQPCTQETELQFKPKDNKSSCKCNSSHHCQMVQKRRRRRFLSTTDNRYKCTMLFFISRLHYRTWIHNCPAFLNPLSIVLSQLKDLLCSELITRDVCSTWHRALQEKFQQNQPIPGQLECVQYASRAHCASPGDSAGPVGWGKNTITVIMPQRVHILKPCGSCKAEAVQESLQVWCQTDLDI